MARDQIYGRRRPPGRFQFNEEVVAVFEDMINRSVPGYELSLRIIELITESYIPPDSRCYDLGSALGASTLAIASKLRGEAAEVVAVDSSPAMVHALSTELKRIGADSRITVRCEDVLDTVFEPASLVVMNYTLQFVAPQRRGELLARVSRSLRDGGVLVLSEKVQAESAREDGVTVTLHHGFKRSMGYTDLEIAQKRDAIADFLRRDTLEQHRRRLLGVGFDQVYVLLKALGFASIVAFKDARNDGRSVPIPGSN